MKLQFAAATALTLAAFLAPAAEAHVTLETPEAAAGSTYKAVLRVPHGCDGQATNSVRVELPEGFVGAKPMPKAGWTTTIERGAYARTYTLHGEAVSDGPLAIVWSGGDLPDDMYDEFVVRGTLAGFEPGEVVAFRTTQTCAAGEVAWTEVAAEGEDPHALESPAPTLRIAAAAAADEHAGHGGHGATAGHDAHAGHAMHAAPPAETGSATIGDIVVESAWIRATPPRAPTAGGYATITNNGDEDDRLVSVATPEAGRGEIHEMSMENDIMRMRPLDGGVPVPAGGTVTLAPGGLHMMLMEIGDGFREGETVPVTLTFEKAGPVDLMLPVAPIGSQSAPSAD